MSKKYLSDFKFTTPDNLTLTFSLSGVNNILALGNALRQSMYSLVPMHAFDIPTFIENSTNETSEKISQRIQSIPIFNEQIDSNGKGKPISNDTLSSLTFQLSVKNTEKYSKYVHTKEFKSSSEKDIEFFNQNIIIMFLFWKLKFLCYYIQGCRMGDL